MSLQMPQCNSVHLSPSISPLASLQGRGNCLYRARQAGCFSWVAFLVLHRTPRTDSLQTTKL